MQPRPIERTEQVQTTMLQLLERASASAPDDLAAARRYLQGCFRLGDTQGAVGALRRLTALEPDNAESWWRLGGLLLKSNQPREAVDAAQTATQLEPERADYLSDYGFALRAVHEDDLADRVFALAVELDPNLSYALRGYGQSLIRRGAAKDLARHCESTMERVGPGSWTIAQYLIALGLLGRKAAVAHLLDYDTLISEREIDCPPGFGSLEAFNAALREEMLACETTAGGTEAMDVLHSGFRVRGGPQAAVRKFGQGGAPASAALLEELARQREAYEGGLPDCLLRRSRPAKVKLESDAIVTYRQSYLAPHTHACSWLNAVYYVVIPEGLGRDGQAGCMEFAPPLHKVALAEGIWPSRVVRPRPGKMVLFAGYMYHHVHASELDAERMAVSFDMVPTMDSRPRGISHEYWLAGLPQE